MPPAAAFQPGDPFCAQCGFLLRGREADPSCPECGAPLPAELKKYDPAVAALAHGRVRRSRSAATLFGWPLVDIAFGPDGERGERIGKARGIIAIGNIAVGGLAIGGVSVGVVAVGGVTCGGVSIGGVAIGALAALGGASIGGHAAGGVAVGGIATGGVATGYVAQGGVATGRYARAGQAKGAHTISPTHADAEAVQTFRALSPLVGASAPGGMPAPSAVGQAALVPVITGGVLAAVIGAVVLSSQRRYDARRRLGSAAADVAEGRG